MELVDMQRLFGPELVLEATKGVKGTPRPSRIWPAVLMAGAGMREHEAAQLSIEDVYEVEGTWIARVTADVDENGARGRRTAKTRHSNRLVPLHPALLKTGFQAFVEARRQETDDHQDPLFPEITGKLAVKSLSEWANRFLRTMKIKRPRIDLYSLRHSFTTHLEHSGVPDRAQRQYVGHAGGGGAHGDYIKPREVPLLSSEVFPALDTWLPEVFKNMPA